VEAAVADLYNRGAPFAWKYARVETALSLGLSDRSVTQNRAAGPQKQNQIARQQYGSEKILGASLCRIDRDRISHVEHHQKIRVFVFHHSRTLIESIPAAVWPINLSAICWIVIRRPKFRCSLRCYGASDAVDDVALLAANRKSCVGNLA
jgi:hypothetical protein